MAGYAAMARVQGGRVRALAWDAADAADAIDAGQDRVSGDAPHDDGPAPTIRERLGWWREELAMMTFFLLDPESWR